VLGSADFAMVDNIAYQPGLGNWVINEDGDGPEVGRNNDIWSCLPDGDDPDDQSDGCVKVVTLNDLTAESTGGVFDKSGTHYYVSIQHNVTGHGVVLDITGWR
jgi:secreted PhoX family phosphatase